MPIPAQNNLQNYPMLTSAVFSGGVLRVNGMLMSVPFTLYRIEVFSDDAADPEARTYLGSFQVAIAATGTASFNGAISTTLPVAGEVITTTATNLSTSDTSEVSAPVAITFPGTFDFAPTTLTVNETDGTATLTVQRNGGIEGTTTVDYTTNDGTATAPSDYAQTSGTLTFAPGVTTHSILIPIVNDGIPEVEESFTVTLSNATGGAAVGAATATVRIAAQLVADPTIPTLSEWGLIVMAIGLALAMLRASTA